MTTPSESMFIEVHSCTMCWVGEGSLLEGLGITCLVLPWLHDARNDCLLLIPNTLITCCVHAHMHANNRPADPEAALHNRSCLAPVTMTMSKQTTPVPRPLHNEPDYFFLSLAYTIILSLLGRGGGKVELDMKINKVV